MQNCTRQVTITGALVMLALNAVRAADFHVATRDQLQAALDSATNAVDDTIWLTNGYYSAQGGTFTYNCSSSHNLTIQAETGVSNTLITLDSGGARDLNLVSSGSGAVTVRGLTFLRDTGSGNSSEGALRIAAGPGGVILVDGCLFLLPAGGNGMGIELVSGANATVTNCVVNGGGGTGISISGVANNLVVQACTVSSNSIGGGLNVSGGASLVVNSCSFTGNSGSSGGGISCDGAALTLTSNVFTGNQGVNAGGAYFPRPGAVAISANTFTGNSAAAGGGLWGNYAASLSGNVFASNSATSGDGGGASLSAFGTIMGNSFVGNIAGLHGGGFACNANTVSGTVFSNSFSGNSSYYEGGGAWIVMAGPVSLSLVANNFISNTISYPPPSSGYGGGLECEGSLATTTLSNNIFIANSTLSASFGGGASCFASNLTLFGNTFAQDIAGAGGGLSAGANGTLWLLDNKVARNLATANSGGGGGIYLFLSSSNLFMINNTVFGNTAVGNGGGIYCAVSGTTEILNAYNNIIWGNSVSSSGSHGADVLLSGAGQKTTFLYNDVHDMYGLWQYTGNLLDVDPQFFDPVNGDYHLRPASPCVNSGTNGAPYLPATDLDGNVRINNGIVDLGCYEFNNSFFHPADTNNDWVISMAEYNAYAAAWKNGQSWTTNAPVISADFATRAGYLLQNGGAYTNDGSAQPTCWKPAH
jgi:Right handed beta helix region